MDSSKTIRLYSFKKIQVNNPKIIVWVNPQVEDTLKKTDFNQRNRREIIFFQPTYRKVWGRWSRGLEIPDLSLDWGLKSPTHRTPWQFLLSNIARPLLFYIQWWWKKSNATLVSDTILNKGITQKIEEFLPKIHFPRNQSSK